MRDFLLPMCATLDAPTDVRARTVPVRGNRMAKACVEMAILDAWLRAKDESLARFLGGTKERIECGVSVGLAPTTGVLLEEIEGYLDQGYRRIKVKVAPGEDVQVLDAVRNKWPDVKLMADANAAYTLDDLPTLMRFDDYNLTMIEQPLAEGDLLDHATLQAAVKTPVCLDESIESAKATADAIALKACRIVNIKAGRVGGYLEAKRVHDVARHHGIPVWCGGMLETGLGRAANLALASLQGFTLPGDTSASNRYFHEDITEPFVMAADGTMAVPRGPGIGPTPRPEALRTMVCVRETVKL
jgi:O-succinylbenzoate synthase